MTPLFKKRRTVVFVCTANVTRSAYLAHRFRRELESLNLPSRDLPKVDSAGVMATPGMNAHPVLVAVLKYRGDSLANHLSQPFDDEVAKHGDLFLTAETSHVKWIEKNYPDLKGKVFPLLAYGREPGWDGEMNIEDPTGGEPEDYKEFLDFADAQAQRLRRVFSRGELFSEIDG